MMKRRGVVIRRVLAAAIVAVLAATSVQAGAFSFAPSVSYADEKSDLEKKLKETKENAREAKSNYRASKAEAESLGKKITRVEASIKKTEKELKDVAEDIRKNNERIARIESEIALLEREVGTQNSELLERLRMMYMTGGSSMIEVLLSSESITDFLSNLDMIQKIHAYDIAVLDELDRKLGLVEDKKDELAKVKEALALRHEDEKRKKNSLAKDKKELAAAQSKARSEAAEALEDLEGLEKASKDIEAELKELESRGTYGGGKMGWPVGGAITSGFGWRVHPISRKRSFHAGIDISAATGTPVRAAADGLVIKSAGGWNGGYGNMVIIDHGSGITTLYGHNSSLAASVGSSVKRGDVIAYAGSTGNSTGPHCHFEVRVNGSPQNPMGWL
jgi:murein DD-endopeptidase MepM/ murein hydrolase activator NlpD